MLKPAMEIVSESWHLYLKNWRQYLPYLIILFVPTLILSALGTIFIYLETYLPASSMATNVVILLIFAASLVLTIWASIALVKAIAASLSGQTLIWKENFNTTNHLIWPTIYTSLLAGLIVFGGLLLLIVPGLIFAIWYSFAYYTVILENARGMQALRASKALVVGRWWAILWRILVIGFVFGLLSIAINIILEVLVSTLPLATFLQSTIASLLTSFVGTILTPLSVTASVILYYSAKQNPITETTPTNPPRV